jgi:hypothetical protein
MSILLQKFRKRGKRQEKQLKKLKTQQRKLRRKQLPQKLLQQKVLRKRKQTNLTVELTFRYMSKLRKRKRNFILSKNLKNTSSLA